ncbi:hypothetical protein H0H87_009494 [Tephrocybe sp. NHM501043]|nr:hypothetical protein H0H87_009494 [Tephrocybe sp. NHM501043]
MVQHSRAHTARVVPPQTPTALLNEEVTPAPLPVASHESWSNIKLSLPSNNIVPWIKNLAKRSAVAKRTRSIRRLVVGSLFHYDL